ARPLASGNGTDAIVTRLHSVPATWRVIMARTPRVSPAAEAIQLSGLQLSWQHIRCLATDAIVMEYLFAVDPEVTRQVTALRLETDAQIHQTMASASSQAAKLVKGE